MDKLPYIQPERELHYNMGILLLITEKLAQTPRNKKTLTIEKMQLFYFLVTRPVFLNKVLTLASKRRIDFDRFDYYTVDTLSVNVDELFDRDRLLILLKILSSKGCLSIEYSKSEGFLFDLTESGRDTAKKVDGGYFRRIRSYLEQSCSLQSLSSSKLNGYINSVLKEGL